MRDMPDDMSDPPTNADLDRWFGPEPDAPATTASSSSRPRGKTSWTHPTVNWWMPHARRARNTTSPVTSTMS